MSWYYRHFGYMAEQMAVFTYLILGGFWVILAVFSFANASDEVLMLVGCTCAVVHFGVGIVHCLLYWEWHGRVKLEVEERQQQQAEFITKHAEDRHESTLRMARLNADIARRNRAMLAEEERRKAFADPVAKNNKERIDRLTAPLNDWALWDNDWWSVQATHLAHQMCFHLDFTSAPILADMLQEAGCTHPVLGILRNHSELLTTGMPIVSPPGK